MILALIGMDVVLIVTCVHLIRKIRSMPKTDVFDRGAKIFKSLLSDADNVSRQFQKQVRLKHDLINDLGTQLDQRINSLTALLDRADIIVSYAAAGDAVTGPAGDSARKRQIKIMALAEKGCKIEDISNRLSIPKGEVKLVLDLNKKFKRSQASGSTV